MKEESKMFSDIAKMIAEKCEIDVNIITRDTNFQNDLKLDSIRLVESIVEIESLYGVEIPERKLFKLHTVGDLVDFMIEAVNE